MGKKYIISENQYNLLLEQNSKLNYLVGKKVNLYYDPANSRLAFTATVESSDTESLKIITYPVLKTSEQGGEQGFVTRIKFRCNYSTGLVDSIIVAGYNFDIPDDRKRLYPNLYNNPIEVKLYNKKLIDEVNLKKLVNCSKPKADYSSTNPESNKMV